MKDSFDILIENFVKSQNGYQYFFVPGQPIPQGRPRVVAVGGRAWAFTPKKTKNYTDSVYTSVARQGAIALPAPYTICLRFCLPPLKTIDELYPTRKSHGDLDNLEKAVLDSLFGKGKIFSDDSEVVSVIKSKRLADTPAGVGVHLWIISGVPLPYSSQCGPFNDERTF